jgi:ribosomal-protein-alanine N-acetyltransferase
MIEFNTRFVGKDAAEILTKIHAECFPRYWNRQAFTDFFTVQNTFAILVNEGEEEIAMMVYRVAFEQADVLTLAVRSAFRGRGIAKKLLENLLLHCAELGAKKLILEVEVGNNPAIKLYENAGFKHIGRRKLYYQQLDGTLTDALVMSKKLG